MIIKYIYEPEGTKDNVDHSKERNFFDLNIDIVLTVDLIYFSESCSSFSGLKFLLRLFFSYKVVKHEVGNHRECVRTFSPYGT